jgi:transcriptional regulator NrdR family protein
MNINQKIDTILAALGLKNTTDKLKEALDGTVDEREQAYSELEDIIHRVAAQVFDETEKRIMEHAERCDKNVLRMIDEVKTVRGQCFESLTKEDEDIADLRNKLEDKKKVITEIWGRLNGIEAALQKKSRK